MLSEKEILYLNELKIGIFTCVNEKFSKSTVELHFLFILSMLTNSQDDQSLITISSIKCLYFMFS